MNKRGVITDFLTSIVVLFVVIIALVCVYIAYDAFNDAIQGEDAFTDESQAIMESTYDRYDNIWDGVLLTIIIGMTIVLLIVSYIIPSNPAYYFFMIVLLIIVGVIGAYLSNAWGVLSSGDDTFGLGAQGFTMSGFIFEHLLGYILIVGLLVTVVFFAKPGEYG